MVLRAYSDGGARGNPGPAGIGVYICTVDTTPVATYYEYIQEKTNNYSEYFAVYRLLQLVKKRCSFATKVEVFLDSELVTKQINGEYKVKNETLQQLHKSVVQLKSEIKIPISFTHILREYNSIADSLANKAMDSKNKEFQWLFDNGGESGQLQ